MPHKADAALENYTRPGDSVLDPFCGSGTTLVACLANGRTAVGADIDILAGMLTAVKCQPRAAERYAHWRTEFAERLTHDFQEIGRAWTRGATPPLGQAWPLGRLALPIPSFPELPYWFPPQLTAALAAIAHAVHECGDQHLEHVALIALSASIIIEALGPSAIDVLDGQRPARRSELLTAVLARVRLGAHWHLLPRPGTNSQEQNRIACVEDRADDLGLELVAPRQNILRRLRAMLARQREDVPAACRALGTHFGLPAYVFEVVVSGELRPAAPSFLDDALRLLGR